MSSDEQATVCRKYGAEFAPPDAGTRMGVALGSLSLVPIYGIRHLPAEGTNGWFLWGGEYSDADDFFEPLCVEHIPEVVAMAIPFLALPPGWGFLTDGTYVDVWYDPQYLVN